MVRQYYKTAYLSSVADDSALIRTLDLLKIRTVARAILRRFYLICLFERCIKQEDFYKGRRSARVRAQRTKSLKNIERLVKDSGN